MKQFDWNDEKNELLRGERGITFEEVVFYISHDGLLDVIEHPNQKNYPGKRIFIINIDEYVYLVPFMESEEQVFLKTIILSRKMTKIYLGGKPK